MLVWTWIPDCSNLALLWHTGWLSLVEGDRGGESREKRGVGGVREGGEEGAGSGIPKGKQEK